MTKDSRFKDYQSTPDQIKAHYQGACRKLKSAYTVMDDDSETAYQLAYEAMLKASLALIFKHNLRVRSIPGHHIAIIEKSSEILGESFEAHMAVFDDMRRNRNICLYDADGFLSGHETSEALDIASDYLELVAKKLGFD
ncbi:MAG: hypothetical protein ABII18_04065 [bacterium]|nr:hypothetical protein [bacterium]MBU1916508.1 hypothetical protein [bacterium]